MADNGDSGIELPDVSCSFCGRPRKQVRHMITGPRKFICADCVARIRGQMGTRAHDPPDPWVVRTTQTSALPPAVTERDHRATLADAFPTMVAQGLATPDQHGEHLSQVYGLGYVELETLKIAPEIAGLVPAELARRHNLIPLEVAGDRLRVAMRDPLDEEAVRAVEALVARPLELRVATPRGLAHALARSYPPAPPVPRPAPGATCSFCGKAESDVLTLVTEHATSICDECIGLCEDILSEQDDGARP